MSGSQPTRVKIVARWLAILLYTAVLFIALWMVLPALLEAIFSDYRDDLDQTLPSRARAHYRYIRRHLQDRFSGYSTGQVLVPSFRVIALSHMACGLMNTAQADPELQQEIAPLLREVIMRARSNSVCPYGSDPAETRDLGNHGLYLAHLNLILGCYRQVSGHREFDALHERVSKHLADLCLRDGDFHVRSWPSSPKWPADQSVLLCSLYVYDKTRLANLSTRPIEGWLAYMRAHASDPTTGLHHSAITRLPYSAIPRGCALSWTTLYMAQFAPEDAANLYSAYRESLAREHLGWAGFREWPEGSEQGSDVDSGPIVFGLGAAATGIGIGPARMFKDYPTYTGIMRLAATGGLPTQFGSGRSYRLAPLLGEAIIFHGETARPWFGPPLPATYPRVRPFPTGPLLLALPLLIVCGLVTWRMRRIARHLRTA